MQIARQPEMPHPPALYIVMYRIVTFHHIVHAFLAHGWNRGDRELGETVRFGNSPGPHCRVWSSDCQPKPDGRNLPGTRGNDPIGRAGHATAPRGAKMSTPVAHHIAKPNETPRNQGTGRHEKFPIIFIRHTMVLI